MRWGRPATPEERFQKGLDIIAADPSSISLLMDYVNKLTEPDRKAMYDKGYGDGFTEGERLTKSKLIEMQEAALRRIKDVRQE